MTPPPPKESAQLGLLDALFSAPPLEAVPSSAPPAPGTGGETLSLLSLLDGGAPEAAPSAPWYRIQEDERLGEGGPTARLHDNLRALKLLRQVQAEERLATPEEQEHLVRYSGWGSLPDLFAPGGGKWPDHARELRSILGEDDWRSAERTVTSAFFTPAWVIRWIYTLASRLGFRGGLMLEPAAGLGHFLGLAPEMDRGARWVTVEPDRVTGAILSLLYPGAQLLPSGLESAKIPAGIFDGVFSNVPFGDYAPFDPEHNKERWAIHDYMIARSLQLAAPGALVALLTSRWTMDKQDPSVRLHLAEQADLIAALRLPDDTFRASAGTDASCDLLLLKKKGAGLPIEPAPWAHVDKAETEDGEAQINEYFFARPNHVLGQLGLRSTQFGEMRPTVRRTEQGPEERLATILEELPAGVLADPQEEHAHAEALRRLDRTAQYADLPDGSYVMHYGMIRQIVDGELLEPRRMGSEDRGRVRHLIKVRDALTRVVNTQKDDAPEEEQESARKALGEAYENFVLRFGWINREERREIRGTTHTYRPNLEAFRSDPRWTNVASLEVYDPETDTAEKAAIFTRRVIRPTVIVERTETVHDALLAVLDQTGRVDLESIGRLWGGRSAEDAREALRGKIYHDPAEDRWVVASEYLSGPVRRKLRDAETRTAEDAAYEENVLALRRVQPRDLEPSEIDVRLGATWIEPAEIHTFVCELLEIDSRYRSRVEVKRVAKEALWAVRTDSWLRTSVAATQTWGTEKAHAFRLIEDSLNQRSSQVQKTVEVTDKRGDTREQQVKDVDATMDAQEKQAAIEARFQSWVWEESERAQMLLQRYNERMNDNVPAQYDGGHLTFPGLSEAITLDPHQKDVAWRIIQTGNTGVFHEVGAGKTLAAIASGMKLRQLGMASKPCFSVLNATLEQWAREFLQAYPAARLLVASAEDMTGDNRRLFTARAATGDYDAIIVTHSAFERLPISEEFEHAFVRQQIGIYREMLQEADAEKDRITVKMLQRSLRRFEERAQRLTGRLKKDKHLTFEQSGIDWLYVDEVQEFKNLDSPSKIPGIPKASRPSQRATDLLMKTMYLHRKTPGRGVVLMTGTPITNTIAELHVMLRFLAPYLLEDYGIEHFDAFAGTFIQRTVALELAPDGARYKLRTRFHFTNLPELIAIFHRVADVRLAESYYEVDNEIEGNETTRTLKLPRPKLAGGQPEVIAVDASAEQQAYIAELVHRTDLIAEGAVDPTDDNMLKVTSDGRKCALDLRLISERYEHNPDGKLQALVENVYRIWEETKEQRLTQLVFCDTSAPKVDRFSVVTEAVRLLVEKGIPREEIIVIQEGKTREDRTRMKRDLKERRARLGFGSTVTLGTGTNVQDHLVANHHVDAPWRPADLDQRDGRMMRRGNRNAVCHILRYVTAGSFDAYLWQQLHYKASMIARVMLGDRTIRRLEDCDGATLSASQVKALASGNPLVLEKSELDQKVLRLSRARTAWEDRRRRATWNAQDLPREIEQNERRIAAIRRDLEAREDTHGDAFRLTLGETEYVKRSEAAQALRQRLLELGNEVMQRNRDGALHIRDRVVPIGRFAGFALDALVAPWRRPELVLRAEDTLQAQVSTVESTPEGNLQTLEAMPRRMEATLQNLDQLIEYQRRQFADTERVLSEVFPEEDALSAALRRQTELERLLSDDGKAGSRVAAMDEDEPEEETETADADDSEEPLAEAA